MSADWLESVILTGRFLRLEPLLESHAEGLHRHLDPETVQYLSGGGPTDPGVAALAEYIARLNALPGRLNWAVVMAGGEVAGRISYSSVNVADRWLEIGTMLTGPFRGGAANPEAKLLLMTRAFETLGANRVQFKVDARNARSRRAMDKLGALEEGVLRRFQVRPDGHARDSVMYSVLPEEWPAVRAGLEARLAAFGPSPNR